MYTRLSAVQAAVVNEVKPFWVGYYVGEDVVKDALQAKKVSFSSIDRRGVIHKARQHGLTSPLRQAARQRVDYANIYASATTQSQRTTLQVSCTI